MTRMTRFAVAVLGCVLVLGSPRLGAQESRGSIAGLVVDSSGGALPGVTVTIVNNGTNATVVQTTNSSGQYTAVLLLPGAYTVTVELSGFQKREYQNIQVHVGERVQLDATLGPASGVRVGARRRREPAARDRQRDDRAGDRLQAHQRNSAWGWNGLWPDAADPRRVVRAVVRAAAADGQRQPSRHDDHRDDQQRVHDRRIEQRRVAGARRHPAARRTRSRSSKSRPPPTTRRSATPARVR